MDGWMSIAGMAPEKLSLLPPLMCSREQVKVSKLQYLQSD